MEELILQLQNYVVEAGILAPLAYLLVMVIAIVISPIPSSPLAIFAGVAFGWAKGFLLTLTGMTTGAIIAFYLARIFGRPLVFKFTSPEKIAKIKKLMPEKKLTLAIFLLRILPLPMFDAISYAAGLTNISFKNFFIATFFGLMPLIFVLSYFGESINNLVYILVALFVIMLFFFIFLKRYSNKHS